MQIIGLLMIEGANKLKKSNHALWQAKSRTDN